MAQIPVHGWHRAVRSTQRKVRMIPLIVTYSAGTPALGSGDLGSTDVTLTDQGTGDLIVTYNTAFQKQPVVVVTPLATAGDLIATLHSSSTTAARILFWDGTDGTTPKDPAGEVHIMIVGSDSADIV